MRSLSAMMASVRRSQMRLVGTPEEESLRRLADALARGVPIVDMPHLNEGEIIVAPEAVFMTAKTREKLAAALESRK
jgi:hypothetical protein